MDPDNGVYFRIPLSKPNRVPARLKRCADRDNSGDAGFFGPMEYGINLMACYFIVYHLGGRVEVQNEENQGASFKLIFPRRPKPDSPAKEEETFIAKVLMNDALWERLITGY